jgi:hypothetical protein
MAEPLDMPRHFLPVTLMLPFLHSLDARSDAIVDDDRIA